MTKIIHKELSYQIIGILYDIFNKIGGGYQEKYYQKAVRSYLTKHKINFLEQVRADLEINGTIIGRYYIDLELGILASFASDSLKYKRILRGYS